MNQDQKIKYLYTLVNKKQQNIFSITYPNNFVPIKERKKAIEHLESNILKNSNIYNNMLYEACQYKQLEVVTFLLTTYNYDIDCNYAKSTVSYNVIEIAIINGSLEILKLLVKYGGNVNIWNKNQLNIGDPVCIDYINQQKIKQKLLAVDNL